MCVCPHAQCVVLTGYPVHVVFVCVNEAKRAQGLSSVEQQEQKRLQRKQRRLNVRSKNKKKSKDVAATASSNQTDDSASPNQTTDAANSLVVKKSKPILNKDGKIVFSKFDFTLTGEWLDWFIGSVMRSFFVM